jgi:hypothetical protein
MSISWKRNRMRSWLPKTSRMILTSISMLDLFSSIGMVAWITGWWITTLFAYWKGMLDIHHELMCQQNKGSFVTETTTKMWHFLIRILSRKDTENVMTRYLVLEYLVYTGAQLIAMFQAGISCVIAYQVGCSSSQSEPIYQNISIWNMLSIFVCVNCMLLCITQRWMKCLDWRCELQIEFDWLSDLEIFKQNPIVSAILQ